MTLEIPFMNAEKFALVTNVVVSNESDGILRDAREYVESHIKLADSVVIISAYYGEEFIKEILKSTKSTQAMKNTKVLLFVFAAFPDVARQEQIFCLKQLKVDIANLGICRAQNIKIRLALNSRFLHAKLLRFRAHGRLPVYVLGSANFSNAAFNQNDEVMISN
jgi:HKD family nuclease